MTNKTRLGLRLTGVAVAVGAGMVTPTAVQSQGLTVEVSRCADIEAPEERLACFDEQVDAARNPRSAAPPAPVAVAPAAVAPAAPAPAAAVTAVVAAGAASSAPGAADPSETVPPDILAKVTELRATVPNSWLITLDNGQVWRQTTPEYYPLRVGLDVRIYFAERWRSYRLTNEALRRYIQVERVR